MVLQCREKDGPWRDVRPIVAKQQGGGVTEAMVERAAKSLGHEGVYISYETIKRALEAAALSLEPGDLLDKLAEHTNLELSWGAHPDDDTEACWQVHRVNGGRNDREWTLVGVGNTPREALYAALPAAPGLTKLQEGGR